VFFDRLFLTTSEFVSAVWQQVTGKLPNFTSDSSKWERIVASGNFFIDQWAREPGVDWGSLYSLEDIGTLGASDTYELDTDLILKVSQQSGDPIRVTKTDGSYTDYFTTTPRKLKHFNTGFYAAVTPRSIIFNKTFTSADPQYGGSITVPVYLKPEHIVGANDEIPVDDPNWLVLVVAADYVRNDVTRKDLREDLINQANASMQRMKEDNESQDAELDAPWSPLGMSW
jgi:hypothetical protein